MPRKLINKNLGRPRTEDTKKEPPHKGVSVAAPQPKQGRPYWSIRWRVGGKLVSQSLPFAQERADAILAASNKSVELGLQKLEEAGKHLAHIEQLGRTLHDELAAYLKAGIKAGKKLGQPYAEPTARNYRKAVDSLTAFAASKNCAHRADGGLYLTEIARKPTQGHSLLWHWKQHEQSKTDNPSSVMALTKCIHAILKAAKVTDTETMFDPRLLQGAIPVRFVAPKQAARVQTADELRRILKAAMELDTAQELVSADIALLLLTTFRRAEQAYLQVRHCHVEEVPPGYVDQLATWIELPGKLSQDPKYNHAKGGRTRNVLMSRATPLGECLLAVLCQGRGKTEWVTSLDYAKLAARVDTISNRTGIDFSTKSLRTTAANHNRRVLGKDAAVNRCGHTEGVADQSYKDDAFAAALVLAPPPSLEASMGIKDEVEEIVDRARRHPRAWGSSARPIPDVFKSGQPSVAGRPDTAAPSKQVLPIAV